MQQSDWFVQMQVQAGTCASGGKVHREGGKGERTEEEDEKEEEKGEEGSIRGR